MSQKSAKAGFLGLILGALAGIFVIAPKGAKQNREDAKKAVAQGRKAAEKHLKEVYEDINDQVEQVVKKTQDLRGKAKEESTGLVEQANVVKDRIRKIITDVRDGSIDVGDEIEKAVSEGKKVATKLKEELTKKS